MNKSPTEALATLDNAFLDVLTSLKDEVTQVAGQASETILERAASYVSDEARRALTNFHKLYFGDADAQANLTQVNRDVDDLFDQAQAALSGGVDPDKLKLDESDDRVQARFSFSGVQKELEAIIRMDQGIRERLVPILSNLQFEDALRQRLCHVTEAWALVIDRLRSIEDFDVELVALELSALATSLAERDLFYKIVVKAPPPADAGVNDVLLFDL